MALTAPDTGFYQGVVRSWESSTVNTVQVDGAVLSNVPLIRWAGEKVVITEADLAAGDRVAVVQRKAAHFVVGKLAYAR